MKKHAFTLVELLIVVAIIGILATIIVVSYSNAQVMARNDRRKADLELISNAVKLYQLENKKYPVGIVQYDSEGNISVSTPYPLTVDSNIYTNDASDVIAPLVNGNLPVDPNHDSSKSDCIGCCYYMYLGDAEGKNFKIIAAGAEFISVECQKIAGEYYDPYLLYNCQSFQISSSDNSKNWGADAGFENTDPFQGCRFDWGIRPTSS